MDCYKKTPPSVLIPNRTSYPVTDRSGRVAVVLSGNPDDSSWAGLNAEGMGVIELARPQLSLSKKAKKHRRGNFGAVAFGISHGGGQVAPGNLKQEGLNEDIMSKVMHSRPFERFAGHGSSESFYSLMGPLTDCSFEEVLAAWHPELHSHYRQNLDALLASDPKLVRNYPHSVFACATVNFGPRTQCFKHRDCANLPFGMCAITALGSFDHTKGGHLILWELGLVIEFPAGSTILIPSAVVSHCNTVIGPTETRYSFTQYSAGSLFRWVEHGCKLDGEYLSQLTEEEIAADKERNASRWAHGVSMLSFLDKIRSPSVQE